MKMLKMNNNLCPKGLDFFCCECNTLKRPKSALDEPGFFPFFVSFFLQEISETKYFQIWACWLIAN